MLKWNQWINKKADMTGKQLVAIIIATAVLFFVLGVLLFGSNFLTAGLEKLKGWIR